MYFRGNADHEFAAVVFIGNWRRYFLGVFFHVFDDFSNNLANAF